MDNWTVGALLAALLIVAGGCLTIWLGNRRTRRAARRETPTPKDPRE